MIFWICWTGFGIYYVDALGTVKLINFDIISSDLSQDAHAVIRGIMILRQQEFFKKIDTKDYIIWCDTGKHFRNNEVMGFLFIELAKQQIHGTLFVFLNSQKKF